MHKHDSLPFIRLWQLKKTQKPKKSNLVQNSENTKGESSLQFYVKYVLFFQKASLPLAISTLSSDY